MMSGQVRKWLRQQSEDFYAVGFGALQFIVGAVATLATVTAGMTLGYSAVTLPAMQTADRVSEEQASWIASLSTIATPIGCLLTGVLLDCLGRRRTLMLVNAPAVVGWILIATALHSEPWLLYQVYAGRLLTGVATGMSSSPATVYVSEVADKSLRGMMVTWSSVGISLGILLVYVIGYLFPDNWRLVAGITTCFPVASVIATWFLLPESPVWLVSRGRIEEAQTSMRLIRSVPEDTSLSESLQQELDVALAREDQQDSWKDTLGFLKRPEAYKPLLVMNAFFFFQQFSGIFVVVFYAVSIVQETGSHLDGYLATVLIGVSRLATTVAISVASRRCGRRALCNASGLGMTLSIWALALYLTLAHDGTVSRGMYGWWPITSLVLYILTSTVGFLTLPWAMIGEVFPARIRGPACGVTTCLAYLFSFVTLKLYPEMKLLWGNHGLFTFYTAMALAGTACMYACLPETRGRSLAQIEDHFRGL
ncbi:Facilitated trehalose transporter Tret1-2-like protein [Cryptotermes secundus]|uniref:Facilitated trehalose transporter Tret1-2-like protein n=1 Tax=Cryptotermes secundus TaxID=105785 RepID=A0A2J7RF90_9NEOP|nr:Facilitated trehalose transporter Tret1-2-like protein [Cryptotermes secundus]